MPTSAGAADAGVPERERTLKGLSDTRAPFSRPVGNLRKVISEGLAMPSSAGTADAGVPEPAVVDGTGVDLRIGRR